MEAKRAMMMMLALVMGMAFSVVQATSSAPAPSPTSDGTSIDQGIAYALMLLALVLTYLIHAADVFNY
ncbi:Arabinogalactan protein 16/20/22/41 [Dillenia turbinata]|uniref:Arabinogalactan protein 16/20/22/41 n=1 Tax=Dillenia turbinata TaxID=194707 RepID=A0AAN8W828_9MAGN